MKRSCWEQIVFLDVQGGFGGRVGKGEKDSHGLWGGEW